MTQWNFKKSYMASFLWRNVDCVTENTSSKWRQIFFHFQAPSLAKPWLRSWVWGASIFLLSTVLIPKIQLMAGLSAAIYLFITIPSIKLSFPQVLRIASRRSMFVGVDLMATKRKTGNVSPLSSLHLFGSLRRNGKYLF